MPNQHVQTTHQYTPRVLIYAWVWVHVVWSTLGSIISHLWKSKKKSLSLEACVCVCVQSASLKPPTLNCRKMHVSGRQYTTLEAAEGDAPFLGAGFGLLNLFHGKLAYIVIGKLISTVRAGRRAMNC